MWLDRLSFAPIVDDTEASNFRQSDLHGCLVSEIRVSGCIRAPSSVDWTPDGRLYNGLRTRLVFAANPKKHANRIVPFVRTGPRENV